MAGSPREALEKASAELYAAYSDFLHFLDLMGKPDAEKTFPMGVWDEDGKQGANMIGLSLSMMSRTVESLVHAEGGCSKRFQVVVLDSPDQHSMLN